MRDVVADEREGDKGCAEHRDDGGRDPCVHRVDEGQLDAREKMSVRFLSGPSSLPNAPLQGALCGNQYGSAARPWVNRAAFVDMLNVAEVIAVRPEDINARQVQQTFADGATLAELEQHLAFLRSLGAPDDAHPRIGVNDDYEVTVMICVVERSTPWVSSTP